MKKLLSFCLSIAMLMSCAKLETVQNPYRRISSIDTDIHDLTSEDMARDMGAKFKSLEFMTLIAYEGLVQFDEHLAAQGSALEDNPHYPGLLVARSQIEELNLEILNQRDELYQAVLNEELAVEARLKSIALIKTTIPAAKTSLDGLVFRQLHKNFSNFGRKVLMDLVKIENKDIKKSLEILYQELTAEIDVFSSRRNAEAEWRSVTLKARLSLKEDPQWVKSRRNFLHETQEMRLALIENRRLKGSFSGTEFPSKVWSLTFDQGNQKIIELLQTHGLKATFFQVTKDIQESPSIGHMVRDAEMDIGVNSYSHRKISDLTSEQREWEISQAAQDLAKLHQKDIKLFRLPFAAGINNSDIRERITKANLINVHWTVDAVDWLEQVPEEITTRVLKQMKASRNDSGIILFHVSEERSVAASGQVMQHLKQDNRRACSVQDVMLAMNAQMKPCARTELSSR